MPDFIDMLALPHTLRVNGHLVGWRDRTAVDNNQFKLETGRWQQLLRQHSGRKFALYLQDTLSFAAALFGAWQAGKTIYLPSDALAETCKTLATEVDGFIGDVEPQWQPLQLTAEAAGLQVTACADGTPLNGDAIGLVVYTSGSTGTAQAIPKKLSQLSTEVATLENLFGAQAGIADIVSTVSHQHIYGLLFKVLWPLSAGRAIHARSAFFPEDLAAIAPQRPWLLLSSPAHLKRLPENPVRPDIRHLQVIFSSGGPLFADVAQTTHQEFGRHPIEIYGSSETGGIAWRQPVAATLNVARDDSWQPMPRVDVRLNSDHDCLEVRSPHLPDDQWLRMADRVEFTDAHRFFLRGRADRIVKLEEKRVSLDQIERLLLASPLAMEVRVLVHAGQQIPGQPPPRERVAAFVVLSAEGRDVLAQQGKLALNTQLRALLADAIESVALPRLWRYLDAMPANTQGKTTVAALSALLVESTEPSAPTSALMSTPTSPARPLLPQHTLTQRSDTGITLALQIAADLLHFQGHFPGTPILPGVTQVDWALTFGRLYFTLPATFLGLQALKFQRVVEPGASIYLELEHDIQKSALAFRFHSDAGPHASGRILLGPAQ